MPYALVMAPEVREWLHDLRKRDRPSVIQVGQAIGMLIEAGPELGRPLADRVHHSRLSNLKELRPGSAGRSEIRILYVFDPRRNAVLLVAGDKAGKWEAWYRRAIPLAEQRYEDYLKQLAGQRPLPETGGAFLLSFGHGRSRRSLAIRRLT